MTRESYTTAGRRMMLQYLQEHADKIVTANELIQYLKEQECKADKTTVYRYLDKLKKEEKLIPYIEEKGKCTGYQYVEQGKNCHQHLHLQCVNCGKVVHLECEFMRQIEEHMSEHHGFHLQCEKSVLYGLCEDCRKEEPHE